MKQHLRARPDFTGLEVIVNKSFDVRGVLCMGDADASNYLSCGEDTTYRDLDGLSLGVPATAQVVDLRRDGVVVGAAVRYWDWSPEEPGSPVPTHDFDLSAPPVLRMVISVTQSFVLSGDFGDSEERTTCIDLRGDIYIAWEGDDDLPLGPIYFLSAQECTRWCYGSTDPSWKAFCDYEAARFMEAHSFGRPAYPSSEALAIFERLARQGFPAALSCHSWTLLQAGRFAEADAVGRACLPAVEAFVRGLPPEDTSLMHRFHIQELANSRSNLALVSLALEKPGFSPLEAWSQGMGAGHFESAFHAGVWLWRRDRREEALTLLGMLPEETRQEMREICAENTGPRAHAWFAGWCRTGLEALVSVERRESAGEQRFCGHCGAAVDISARKVCVACGHLFHPRAGEGSLVDGSAEEDWETGQEAHLNGWVSIGSGSIEVSRFGHPECSCVFAPTRTEKCPTCRRSPQEPSAVVCSPGPHPVFHLGGSGRRGVLACLDADLSADLLTGEVVPADLARLGLRPLPLGDLMIGKDKFAAINDGIGTDLGVYVTLALPPGLWTAVAWIGSVPSPTDPTTAPVDHPVALALYGKALLPGLRARFALDAVDQGDAVVFLHERGAAPAAPAESADWRTAVRANLELERSRDETVGGAWWLKFAQERGESWTPTPAEADFLGQEHTWTALHGYSSGERRAWPNLL